MKQGDRTWTNAVIFGFLCLSAIAATAATVGPVAHWKFDEQTNVRTAADSVTGRTGALIGGAAFVPAGIRGNALSLVALGSGALDMGVVFPFTNGNFSISMWVKTAPGESLRNMTLLSKNRPASPDGYALQVSPDSQGVSGGAVAFHVGGAGIISGGVSPVSTTVVTDGNWHHIVATHQFGGNKVIYVDGLPLEDTKPVEAFIDLNNPLVVGARYNGAAYSEFFNGSVDELQLYDRALQDTEIQFLFENAGSISTSPSLTSLNGTVRDAVTGNLLPNVLVSVKGESAVSNPGGTYQISNLNPGLSTVEATVTGYSSIANSLNLSTQAVNNFSFAMSPTIEDSSSMRVVLTWGQFPSDLDSHLLTPVISNFNHHIAYFNPGSLTTVPFANLDVDDVFSFGPETITLTNLFPGVYHYYVHNFSGSFGFDTNFANSAGEVRFFTASGEVATRSAPTSPDGNYWYVARIHGDSKTITVVDEVTTTEPTTNGAPYFTFVSGDSSVLEGSDITFTAIADGFPTITYEWFLNDVRIPNETGSNLVITNAQLEQAGEYHARATSGFGAGQTLPITLNLITPRPVIVRQPEAINANESGSASFSVAAIGEAPLLYQWRKNGLDVVGATSPILTLTNLAMLDEAIYKVVVFNSRGFEVSTSVLLSVAIRPSFISQPLGQTIPAGGTFSLNVQNRGPQPFFYQWLRDNAPIGGATDPTYRVDSAHFTNSGIYTVVVSNSVGTATSNPALISVNSAPVVLSDPLSQQASSGSPAMFNANIVGSQPLHFQWFRSGSNLPAATNLALSFSSAQLFDNGFYGIWASNAFGSVTSSLARLHVLGANAHVPWTDGQGGSGTDEARSVAIAPDGSVYVAGHFNLVGQFGTNQLTSVGREDVFVSKLNSAGTIQWIRQIGGAGSDFANGIAVDTNGNLVVVGSFSGNLTGTLSLTNADATSFTDIFVAKFDTNGTVLWANREGKGFSDDLGRSVALDMAGNVFISGSSFQSTFGSTNMIDNGRILLAKYGMDGSRIWARKLGDNPGHRNDVANAVATDNNGNVVIVGSFQSARITLANVITNQGGTDGFIAKYDTTGQLMWHQSLGGPGDEVALSVALNNVGDIFVCGDFNLSLTIGSTTINRTADTVQDGFVARLDANGNPVWLQGYGGGSAASARGLTIAGNGNVFVTGYFAGDTTFGSSTFSSIRNTLDIFVLELMPDGQVKNFQQAGGEDSGGDIGNAIAVDTNGDQIVVGSFTGTVGVGNNTIQSAGRSDVFISRISGVPTGALQLTFNVENQNIVFSWPVEFSGFIVQEKLNSLIGTAWQNRVQPLSIVNGRYYMTNQISTNFQFFRLHRP
jgi:hypothetical protein